MMTHRDPNRLVDKIIFWTCLVVTFCLMIATVYDYGFEQGKATCRPSIVVPQQMSYPKTKKEMQRFLKTYQVGGVR
jgi:hypothetical protein